MTVHSFIVRVNSKREGGYLKPDIEKVSGFDYHTLEINETIAIVKVTCCDNPAFTDMAKSLTDMSNLRTKFPPAAIVTSHERMNVKATYENENTIEEG